MEKKAPKHAATVSDQIDGVVTHRALALPIFVAVMFLIYAIAMGPWPVFIWQRHVISRQKRKGRMEQETIRPFRFTDCNSLLLIV